MQLENPGFVRSFITTANYLINKDNLEDYYILEDMKIPTLVVWGDKDVVCDYNNIYTLQEAMPSAICKTIHNSSHSFIHTRAKETSEYIDEFIKSK